MVNIHVNPVKKLLHPTFLLCPFAFCSALLRYDINIAQELRFPAMILFKCFTLSTQKNKQALKLMFQRRLTIRGGAFFFFIQSRNFLLLLHAWDLCRCSELRHFLSCSKLHFKSNHAKSIYFSQSHLKPYLIAHVLPIIYWVIAFQT